MEKWEYKIIEFTTGMFKHGEAREQMKGDADLLDAVSFREIGEKKGILGGTKKISVPLSTQKMEDIFNELGKEGWILCETVPLITNVAHAFRYGTRTTAVQFIFKRKKFNERERRKSSYSNFR